MLNTENMKKKDSNILKLSVSGFSEESWNRLQDSLFRIIDKVSNKIDDSTSIDKETIDFTSSILKDISAITSVWAKAKMEKPSLENEKIKAEIAEKFAQTKKILKDTEKTDEEIKSLRIENRHKELSYYLDELERVFTLMQKFRDAQLFFSKDGQNASLFIGGRIDQYKLKNENQQGITKNIVHLADSTNNEDDSSK